MKRFVNKGSLVKHSENAYRVIEVSKDGSVTLENLDAGNTFSVPFTEVSLLETEGAREEYITDRRLAWLEQSKSNPVEMQVAITRAECIDRLLSGKISRANLLLELEISVPTLTRLLRRYDPELGAVSLMRNVRGRKAATRMLSPLHEQIIEDGIKRYLNKTKKLCTFTEMYEYVESKCVVNGLKPPSPNTIKNRLESFGDRAIYSIRRGREAMLQKFEMKPGSIDVETILSMVQVDHTKVDVIIRDSNGLPLMRPWLTVVIDLKSRIVLGYYLALHPPSALSVAMALLSACYPKSEQPMMMGGGIGTLHRFWGTPVAVGTDNAAEFTSDEFAAALGLYDIELLLRPIGKKHYGGHVERLIGTLMGKVHMLPGTTYSNVLTKADYDSAKESALTYQQLCKWFADQVAIYHGRAHEGLGRRSPSEVWDEEMAKLGPQYIQPIPGDFRTFALDFFPSFTRTVQTKGVEFKGDFYVSSVIRRLVGQRLTFKYNPLNLGKIWLRLEGRYYEIPYSDITKQPISLSEYYASNRSGKRRRGELIDPTLHELRLQAHDDIDNAVAEAKRVRQHIAKKAHGVGITALLENKSFDDSGLKPLAADQARKKLDWKG
ncbi:DDE-type integrase/transposase/recombinase [Pseudomonas alloputida]|uniref:DDE-type integrase/transposase/recombinase n=1 Tax=Pseudomonas alloputida TaxID=1940621 RepID=A0AAW7HJ32_9PSED|nr:MULTISPECIES: Mu transposase C-terminal domain-containing protein [Pseudomonas]MBA1216390.1 transposase [Pseudomonas fulva]MBA1319559.1 transposase [Pseudomonas monteilii]MBA6105412.1 transposase [Pseudomonas monteilii]MBH3382670.1 transposase [Pseudomonas juntendi]MCE0860499.1 DDE-type integrase/transposase/recombinase [Pseudomonas alloputida]